MASPSLSPGTAALGLEVCQLTQERGSPESGDSRSPEGVTLDDEECANWTASAPDSGSMSAC
jgi:hypothetical protein